MEDKGVVEIFIRYGLAPTLLFILLFLIVQDPNRAYKLKSLILNPFFKIFKWFKREYIASVVANNLNTFFSKELYGDPVAVKINWVKTENDPIFKSGKLIIRMIREDDQAKNILTATKYALPKIVCPIFRHHIKSSYANAIDFTFLQKLADKLGNHGKSVFKKYFLNPEIEVDPIVVEVLQKLTKIDRYGIFTTIFINELDYIGEGLFADSDTIDRTPELIKFINYLLNIAERELGEEIELMNFSDIFKVSIILLAKSQTATRKGLMPYLRRLNINLEKGSDSTYIVAFPPAFDFLNKFVDVIDGNQRVTIEKIYKTQGISQLSMDTSINVCCLRRNKLFTNESFVKKIEANEIKVGKQVQGTVIDCSQEEALVSFLGVDGTIKKSECSWMSHHTCNDVLQVGEVKTFLVKSIDNANGNISLTLKLDESDPWKRINVPKVNDEVELYIINRDSSNFKCIFQNLIEVQMPCNEISWYQLSEDEKNEFINSTVKAKIIKVSEANRLIECSFRQLDKDPWPTIHDSIKIGTEFNGKVHEVAEHFVRVKIGNGLVGKITKESLTKAGHEYADYRNNLVIGQGIDVVVTKVFLSKRWIRLDLKRNLN